MKRLLSYLTVLFLLFGQLTDVYASSNSIRNLTIDCTIDSQGTATFVEKWDMDVSEGTEGYKVFNNMDNQPVTLIKVTDNKGTAYQNIGEWNSDVSQEEKVNKCGLIKDGGHYELCFGIGDYGHRTYTMTYKVSHFVNQYKDQQGINYAFLSDMSLDVAQATIHVKGIKPFNKNNSKIWAFGYSGYVNYEDDSVVLKTEDSLNGNKMQLLMGLKSNDYTSPNTAHQDEKFNDVVKDAKKGSNYSGEKSSSKTVIFAICAIFASIIAFVFVIIKKLSDSEEIIFENGRKINGKEVTPFRDIPCHKNMFLFYYLVDKLNVINEDGRAHLISGFILKWVRDGYITIQEKEAGLFFKKESYDMHLDQNAHIEDELEEKLYKMFIKAANKEGILGNKQFSSWCGKHYEQIDDWFEEVDEYVEELLEQEGYIKDITTYTHFFMWNIPHDKTVFTDKAYEQSLYVWGFYNFLKDEDNMKEKAAIEVKLWDEYLIFAAILGIADRVQKQLKVALPRYEEQSMYYGFPMYYYTNTFVNTGIDAASSAASQGMGGMSSFSGGGGGFSGGGGGGVR